MSKNLTPLEGIKAIKDIIIPLYSGGGWLDMWNTLKKIDSITSNILYNIEKENKNENLHEES